MKLDGYLILYDISNTRRRTKIMKVCKRFGYIRLQKSVYVGYKHADQVLKTIEKECVQGESEFDYILAMPIRAQHLEQYLQQGLEFPFAAFFGVQTRCII